MKIEKFDKWKKHTVDEYAQLIRDEMEANGLHPERHEQSVMECAAIMVRIRKDEEYIEKEGFLVMVPTPRGQAAIKNPAIMMLNYDEQRFAALAARLGILVNMGGRPNDDSIKMEDNSNDKLASFIGKINGVG